MPRKIIKPKTSKKKSAQDVTHPDSCLGEKRVLTGKELRQARFLQAYTASDYNISEACRRSNTGRKTFYHWLNGDPAFVENLKQVQDEKNEIIESALFEKARNGDTISMIFWLKSKAGWVDQPNKQHIEISKGPSFDQEQLDAMVRGRLTDRSKYTQMLGID